MPVLLEVSKRTLGCVDWDVRKVGAAEALQLCVQVREVAALKQRIVGEVDAGWHVLGHERHLLGLGEEVVGHPIQNQAPHGDGLEKFLGDNLGGIEHVEVKVVGELLVK
jgi:hypothetical protein